VNEKAPSSGIKMRGGVAFVREKARQRVLPGLVAIRASIVGFDAPAFFLKHGICQLSMAV
jgi:hypothetical protein